MVSTWGLWRSFPNYESGGYFEAPIGPGVYEVRHGGRRIEFRFQPKGERHLPTALASMTAKYLRELAMRPFNAFWQRHIPDLKATAGYPTDAHRFFSDIRPARRRLKIADHVLWRER